MVLSCVLPRPAFLLPIRLSPDTTDLIKLDSEFYEALAFDFFNIIIGGISRARPPISATPPNSHKRNPTDMHQDVGGRVTIHGN